jgi:hypothetical protein
LKAAGPPHQASGLTTALTSQPSILFLLVAYSQRRTESL